jgi:hypothetical protein
MSSPSQSAGSTAISLAEVAIHTMIMTGAGFLILCDLSQIAPLSSGIVAYLPEPVFG